MVLRQHTYARCRARPGAVLEGQFRRPRTAPGRAHGLPPASKPLPPIGLLLRREWGCFSLSSNALRPQGPKEHLSPFRSLESGLKEGPRKPRPHDPTLSPLPCPASPVYTSVSPRDRLYWPLRAGHLALCRARLRHGPGISQILGCMHSQRFLEYTRGTWSMQGVGEQDTVTVVTPHTDH